MKSLIEEASSISKAIEKAWERASRPFSFSVKVFELPEKNFIGMTTKYAKVGIFFEDKKAQQDTGPRSVEKAPLTPAKRSFEKKSPGVALPAPKAKDSEVPEGSRRNKAKNHTSEEGQRAPHSDSKPIASNTDQANVEITATWSQEMKTHLEGWLREVLVRIGLPQVEFICHEQKNVLKVNFDSPLIGNELKESLLYKNLSYLGMVSLRTHFKNEMKHLKILLSRE